MKYNRDELYHKAIKHAGDKEKRLIFIEDVVTYMGISKPTFYLNFPPGSNELNEIKRLLEENKVEVKVSLRSKWYKSNVPTLQLALYRLLSTPEEHALLNQTAPDSRKNDEPVEIDLEIK